jgi:hypothetical protein
METFAEKVVHSRSRRPFASPGMGDDQGLA